MSTVIGQRIREARKKLGLSQGEGARKIGVVQSNLSRWENGQVLPLADTLARIEKAWGIKGLVEKPRPPIGGSAHAEAKFRRNEILRHANRLAELIPGDVRFRANRIVWHAEQLEGLEGDLVD